MIRRALRLGGSLVIVGAPAAAHAQEEPPTARSTENAVRQAVDAFGISVGREELGRYGSADVRGFSPNDAGNARIDGLYFDPVSSPTTASAARRQSWSGSPHRAIRSLRRPASSTSRCASPKAARACRRW